MKKNNKKMLQVFRLLNVLILILIILNLIMYLGVLPAKYHVISPFIVSAFILFLIFVTSQMGNQYFAMDTKGETITFESKNIGFFAFLDPRINKIDLPKYKLVKYEYQNGIISKGIIFYINSKKNPSQLTKIRFRLAYVSNRNINNIIGELDKIVQSNYQAKDNVVVI